MRVALCISGQLRCFNDALIIKGFEEAFSDFEYDIFISTWVDERLESNDIFSRYKNVKKIKIDDHNDWLHGLDGETKQLMTIPNPPHKNTSAQQLFKIYDCNELKKAYEKENGFEYDVVFRVRPDSLFVTKIILSDFKPSTIFNINFGMARHEARIYDIFFYGDSKTMDCISDSFNNYAMLINDDFSNGLNKVDACRLLYLQAIKNEVKVETINTRVCEVYRGEPEADFMQMIRRLGYENK